MDVLTAMLLLKLAVMLFFLPLALSQAAKHKRVTTTVTLSIFHAALSNLLLNSWGCWVTFLRYPLLLLQYGEPENTALGFGFLTGSRMNKRYEEGTRRCLSPPLSLFVQQASQSYDKQ